LSWMLVLRPKKKLRAIGGPDVEIPDSNSEDGELSEMM